jgi:NADPH-dependent curcumin reductase
MSSLQNKQVRLAARPVGLPTHANWEFVTEAVRDPGHGGVLVKNLMLSLDPAMRGWMNEGKSYIRPVAIGEVMRAAGVGRVVQSTAAGFAVGDMVVGISGVQEYASFTEKSLPAAGLIKIDTSLAAPEKWLNALGMPGMTGYFGLLEVGQPKAGETVVVSGAAGAVGQTVGQVARLKGCRVVGIAGGAAKCACVDYKAPNFREALKAACPKGVDVYFDNVGGEILDAVLARITLHARIIICGAISQYNNTGPVKGPANYLSLLVNRARMEGIVVFDYAPRYTEAVREIAGWMREGHFQSREDIVDGLEQFPEALLKLFTGANFGKLVLRVAKE